MKNIRVPIYHTVYLLTTILLLTCEFFTSNVSQVLMVKGPKLFSIITMVHCLHSDLNYHRGTLHTLFYQRKDKIPSANSSVLTWSCDC